MVLKKALLIGVVVMFVVSVMTFAGGVRVVRPTVTGGTDPRVPTQEEEMGLTTGALSNFVRFEWGRKLACVTVVDPYGVAYEIDCLTVADPAEGITSTDVSIPPGGKAVPD